MDSDNQPSLRQLRPIDRLRLWCIFWLHLRVVRQGDGSIGVYVVRLVQHIVYRGARTGFVLCFNINGYPNEGEKLGELGALEHLTQQFDELEE